MKRSLFILFFIVVPFLSGAQGSVSDSILSMSLFQFHGAIQQPFGDMGELYGTNAAIGFSFAYKTRKNILLGADFSFLFGDQVENPDMLFRELRTSSGGVIDINSEFVNFLILERGYIAGFYAGKIFPVFGPNPNSGLVVKVGLNYFEHRTWIETRQNDIPPLEGDYRKGYDRKRAGLAISEFVGYQHFSNNRFANFYAGFDFYQGFTTDYRSYNFDEMRRTNDDYFDLLVGFRLGWVIPVYKKAANKFYLD